MPKFVCKQKYNYRCELRCHLENEKDLGGQRWDSSYRDIPLCPIENLFGKQNINYEVKPNDQWASEAKQLVKNKVRHIVTKICCCSFYELCNLKRSQLESHCRVPDVHSKKIPDNYPL